MDTRDLVDYPPSDDNSPLLVNNEPNIEEISVFHKGSIKSSVFNLTNSILGAGILSVPWAFLQCGVILTIILFLFATFVSQISLYIIIIVAKELQEQKTTKKDSSEMEVSYSLASKLTHPLLQVYCDGLIMIQTFGISTAYLIVVGDLMPEVFKDFMGKDEDDPDEEWYEGRRAWISFAAMFLYPLCVFMKKLDGLKFTSFLALGTVVYVTICAGEYYISNPYRGASGVSLFKFGWDIFAAFPIIVFSFGCQIQLLPIYLELKNPTDFRIRSVINFSLLSSLSLYISFGLFAYLTYGDDTDSDVLTNYPTHTQFIIGKIGITLLVIFSFPLQTYPFRLSMHNLLIEYMKWHSNPLKDSKILFFLEMTFCVLSSYGVSMMVDDLGIVFSILGATGAPSICYILPGVFYLKHINSDFSDWYRIFSIFLIGLGVLVTVLGITVTFVSI